MQHKNRVGDALAPIALPIAAKFPQESGRLAEKLAAQIKWMRKRGIDITLQDSERPRPAKKPSLPGTVLYFSKNT